MGHGIDDPLEGCGAVGWGGRIRSVWIAGPSGRVGGAVCQDGGD
jgi:hypothetical protein